MAYIRSGDSIESLYIFENISGSVEISQSYTFWTHVPAEEWDGLCQAWVDLEEGNYGSLSLTEVWVENDSRIPKLKNQMYRLSGRGLTVRHTSGGGIASRVVNEDEEWEILMWPVTWYHITSRYYAVYDEKRGIRRYKNRLRSFLKARNDY